MVPEKWAATPALAVTGSSIIKFQGTNGLRQMFIMIKMMMMMIQCVR